MNADKREPLLPSQFDARQQPPLAGDFLPNHI
jgi:hypothetical protein